MKKDTKFIELTCGDCILRISPWVDDGVGGSVSMEVISTSASRWHTLFGTRIRNAWKVLRGQWDWSGWDIWTKDEVLAIISALQQASDEVWSVDEES